MSLDHVSNISLNGHNILLDEPIVTHNNFLDDGFSLLNGNYLFLNGLLDLDLLCNYWNFDGSFLDQLNHLVNLLNDRDFNWKLNNFGNLDYLFDDAFNIDNLGYVFVDDNYCF